MKGRCYGPEGKTWDEKCRATSGMIIGPPALNDCSDDDIYLGIDYTPRYVTDETTTMAT